MRAVTAHNDVNEASFDYDTALYIESVLAQGSPESAGCKEYLLSLISALVWSRYRIVRAGQLKHCNKQLNFRETELEQLAFIHFS